MRNFFITPKQFSASLFSMFFFLIILFLPSTVKAQSDIEDSENSGLFEELAIMDSLLFESTFKNRDHKAAEKLLAEDYEFYHDKVGLTSTSRNEKVEKLKNRGPNLTEKRELVEGSLEVYPLNNYGAIQMGEHQFHKKQEDGSYKLYEKAKFTHLWKKEADGNWKLSMVLSYDHQPVPQITETDNEKVTALTEEVKQLDSLLFAAILKNRDHIAAGKILAPDVEFYHDKHGLIGTSRDPWVESLKNRGPNATEKREFVEGSLEVYPMNNYGAIQMGEHLFYEKQEDGSYKLYEKAKYTHLWKQEDDGQWKLTRVLSYDHQAVE